MKYDVLMEVDSTVSVEVEADSPEEAFEKAGLCGVDCGDLNVNGAHPLNAIDENGETIESGW